MKSTSWLLAAGLITLSLSGTAAQAGERGHARACSSIGGTIAASLVGPSDKPSIVGSVTGTLRGGIQGTIGAQTQNAQGALVIDVTDVFVTEEGFQLETTDKVTLIAVPNLDGVFHHDATHTIVRGTGKFARATGTITSHGEADLAGGTITTRYEGQLCGLD